MRFLILLKKELLDLANKQIIVTFGVMFFMLFMITGFTGKLAKDVALQEGTTAVLDEDKSAFTTEMLATFEREGVKIIMLDNERQAENYIIIPKGFEAGILKGERQTLKTVATLKSLSVTGAAKAGGCGAADRISRYVSEYLAEKQYAVKDISMLLAPVTVQPVTFVSDKSADISIGELIGALMNNSIFVPVIVMILTMFAAQMISMAVINEKTDKTLETLMSTPVSKTEILLSKIVSAMVIAAILAAVLTLVLSGQAQMGGGAAMAQTGVDAAITELGLKLSSGHYALLGLDILLTVAIALCVAFVLTIISSEPKSTQLTIYPLVILTVIPYILTILADVNSLPTIPRLIVLLIPFTHTFAATENILFGNIGAYAFGVCYQALFLAATVFVTVKIFSSDVIFTGIKKKPKNRAPGNNNY